MRNAAASLIIVLMIIATPFAIVFSSQVDTEASVNMSTPMVECKELRIGQEIKIRCSADGKEVLNETIRIPAATPEPPTIPSPPAQNPSPTPQPQPSPGPTKNATLPTPAPEATRAPETPAATPRETAEEPLQTVSPGPRQTPSPTATIEPPPVDDTVLSIPEIELDIAEAVGIGTLGLLLLTGLFLLGMYAGYYMGYKDSDKAEAKFYKSLLRR